MVGFRIRLLFLIAPLVSAIVVLCTVAQPIVSMEPAEASEESDIPTFQRISDPERIV